MGDPNDPAARYQELLERLSQPFNSVEDLVARRFDDPLGANVELPEIAHSEQVTIRQRHGAPLRVEVYTPLGDGPFPPLVYLHGGAWYTGSAAGVRRVAQLLCAAGFVVANVDYALAPEFPFPAAVEDGLYASRWFAEHAVSYGGDGGALALAGDSAGANIAAAVAARLIGSSGAGDLPLDEGDRLGQQVALWAMVLAYGVFDMLDLLAIGARDRDRPGFHETVVGAYLGYRYLEKITDPLVSPGGVVPSGWPPVYLTCGSADTLMDQSLSFARTLAGAHVSTTLSIVADAPHGFIQLDQQLSSAAVEMRSIVQWLRRQAAERNRLASPLPTREG